MPATVIAALSIDVVAEHPFNLCEVIGRGIAMKRISVLAALAGAFCAMTAHADPVSLSEAQMDAVTAGGAPTPTGFVCPVITTDAVLHSPKGAAIGEGHYTIGGPTVAVPTHATNGDGTGTPGGPHSQPGDTDYTAIWSFQ